MRQGVAPRGRASGRRLTLPFAALGTVIAFVLALLVVFLRIQTFGCGDSDAVKFVKAVGTGFAKVYSTVVRGAPMMVQGLLIYWVFWPVAWMLRQSPCRARTRGGESCLR